MLSQYLRIVWARKWLVLLLFVLVSAAGIGITFILPRQYTAETSLIVEMRIDPVLGALAPALAAPSYMATQIGILKSDRVAARAVKLLGVERSPEAGAQWREETKAKIPLDRYFADLLEKRLSVEPTRGSNVLNLSFSAQDPIFAQAAANAFAQAYMDVSVELRVAPARQSASFLDEKTKTLRSNLEQAQSKLSKYQQTKGIVVSDELLDQENARYNALITQLALAAETRRVAGSASVSNRGSSEKVAALQAMVDAQKKQLLALRSDHDQISVYQRDIDTAQRAYDAVTQRLSMLNLEGQNNQANTRLLSPAVEPIEPSRPKILLGIIGSLVGGLAAGFLAALALGMRARRVGLPEALLFMAGVPVIGVLRPVGSKQPVFRRLLMVGAPSAGRPALAAPRMRS